MNTHGTDQGLEFFIRAVEVRSSAPTLLQNSWCYWRTVQSDSQPVDRKCNCAADTGLLHNGPLTDGQLLCKRDFYLAGGVGPATLSWRQEEVRDRPGVLHTCHHTAALLCAFTDG